MLIYESMPIVASLISSVSRAGLNVVDRYQFKNVATCPIVMGYWNSLLPVVFIFPLMLFSPATSYFMEDVISMNVVFLALLIQLVAYSFGYTFRFLRVTDVAIISKSADITVPIFLSFFGFYSLHLGVFWILPPIIFIYILSAGIKVAVRAGLASLALVTILSIQGIYSYFIGLNSSLNQGIWGLLSFASSVILWRCIFSFLVLTYAEGFLASIQFPRYHFSVRGFCVRGLLTVITQVTFLLAICANQLMLVWPILNTTGLTGAIFAYLFLGEDLRPKDFVFIFLTFLLTGLVMVLLNYEKFKSFLSSIF